MSTKTQFKIDHLLKNTLCDVILASADNFFFAKRCVTLTLQPSLAAVPDYCTGRTDLLWDATFCDRYVSDMKQHKPL